MSRVGASPRNLCGDPWERELTQDFLSPQKAPSFKTFPVPCVSFLIPITKPGEAQTVGVDNQGGGKFEQGREAGYPLLASLISTQS